MARMIYSKIFAGTIVPIIIFIGLLYVATASVDDISELRHQISSFDDPKINVEDLAFYLVTHSYDASPKDGYVELKLNGTTYKLVPNGNQPGLCDILPANAPNK